MSEKIEKPKGDAPNEPTARAAAAGAAALAGLAVGTLVGGPVVGIAFALVWGIQAAACAGSSDDIDSNGVS